MSDAALASPVSLGDGRVVRRHRVADRFVVASGPDSLVDRVLGPLAALASDDRPPAEGAPIDVVVEALAPADVPPAEDPRTTRWVPASPPEATPNATQDATPDAAPSIVASGIGVAVLARSGPLTIRVAEDLPRGDETAERLTIPALAERLRREDVHFVHAASLLAPDRAGAWLVPAARGGGKTTLSLSLRRAGWRLLSDDRGWLFAKHDAGSDASAVYVDPWPEPPRVGDRGLFLLPPHVATGARDPLTGKAKVPSLSPPRLHTPVRVLGVLLPRLVDGPGGEIVPVVGASALAAFAPHAVIANEPATATASLHFVARLLSTVPCFSASVGDDPTALAAAVAAHALRAGPP